jgi:hypothetical protein
VYNSQILNTTQRKLEIKKICIDNVKQNLYFQYFISLLGILQHIGTKMGNNPTFPEQTSLLHPCLSLLPVRRPPLPSMTFLRQDYLQLINGNSYSDQWQCPQRSMAIPTAINGNADSDQWQCTQRSMAMPTAINDNAHSDQWQCPQRPMAMPTAICSHNGNTPDAKPSTAASSSTSSTKNILPAPEKKSSRKRQTKASDQNLEETRSKKNAPPTTIKRTPAAKVISQEPEQQTDWLFNKIPAQNDECGLCFLNCSTAKCIGKGDRVCCQECNVW